MIDISNMTFPIQSYPEWEVIDSSKLNDYILCSRMYFFIHILGWKSTSPRNDLKFGEAWHVAMEHLLLHGYSNKSVVDAYDKFLECYREEFDEESDELFGAKTPNNALKALAQYSNKYERDLDELEILYTEIVGTVPITSSQVLHFKMDSIFRQRGGANLYGSFEHKTKGGGISQSWFNTWLMSIQIGTYHHVLYCLYPENVVDGVKINGAGFLKTKFDFQRLPIKKTRPQMQVWLSIVLKYIDDMKRDLDILSESDASDNLLDAFAHRPQACDKWWGCPFLDYCISWPNPLRECDEPPMGYKVEFWDPRRERATTKMDLTEGGGIKKDV